MPSRVADPLTADAQFIFPANSARTSARAAPSLPLRGLREIGIRFVLKG